MLIGSLAAASPPSPIEDSIGSDLVSTIDRLVSSHQKPPIVLVHGWQGTSFDKADCDDTNPTDPDFGYPDALWDRVDEDFAALGFPVEMARLKTGSSFSEPNCSPVAEANVVHLMAAIDRALAATGQEKVLLVAHSMGGLVSRAYLESSSYRDDVMALFTLGTPHIGVPVNALATIVEVLTLGIFDLADYCVAQPVVCQFSDNESANPPGFAGIATFNAVHETRAAGVYYHLLGGDIDFDHRSLTCDPIYLVIGVPNDCIVPLASAKGEGSASGSLGPLSGSIDRLETFSAHLESFDDDPSLPLTCDYHYNFKNKDQYCTNLLGSASLNQSYSSNSFTDCLEPSISNRLPRHTCGTVASAGAGIRATRAPGSKMVRAPSQRGSLKAGTRAEHDFRIEGGPAVFTVVHRGDRLRAHLVSPDGTIVDAARVASEPGAMQYKETEEGVLYLLDKADPGLWRVVVEAVETSDEEAPYLVLVSYQSTVELEFGFDQGPYRPGRTASVSVDLVGAADDVDLTLLLSGDGVEVGVPLRSRGNGRFEASFETPDRGGYHQLTLDVTGFTVDGKPFSRRETRLLAVAPQSLSLTGGFVDRLAPARSPQSPFQDLAIDVELSADLEGLMGLSADLVDRSGRTVAHSAATVLVQPGTSNPTLRFRGADLLAGTGPYVLTNVSLVDYEAGGIVVESAENVYTTSRYTPTELRSHPDPAARAASRLGQRIDLSPHSCYIDNPGPFLAGSVINVDFDVTLTDEDPIVEWLDHYFVDAPDAWTIRSQTAPPADHGGWGRATAAVECDAPTVGYWGIASPFLAPLANPCELRLDSLPAGGSFNGPWAESEYEMVLGPEGFEGAFPPTGWLTAQTDGESYSNGFQKTGAVAHTGAFSAWHNDDDPPFLCLCDAESWLVLPRHTVAADDELVFWQRQNFSMDDHDVQASLGSSNPDNGDFFELADLSPATSSWQQARIDLSAYRGKNLNLAFRYNGDANDEWFIDDVSIQRRRLRRTVYNFGISFEVDNSPSNRCPGSFRYGVSSDPADARAGLVGVALGDLGVLSVNATTCGIAQPCPLPDIDVAVSVTTDQCPGVSNLEIPASNQTVSFCYEVTNRGEVTVVGHTYTDTGIRIDGAFSHSLAPGLEHTFTRSHTFSGAPGECFSVDLSWNAETLVGLGQPQGLPASVPFIDTRYSAQAAHGGTQICIANPLFADGFESGDTSAWSASSH